MSRQSLLRSRSSRQLCAFVLGVLLLTFSVVVWHAQAGYRPGFGRLARVTTLPARAAKAPPVAKALAPLATITVTSSGDGAANAANCPGANCRLRDAIAAAAAAGDTVSFNVTGTITLTVGELGINKNLTIQGPARMC